nr:ribosomal protein S18 [Gronococcus sybilensis]
MNTHQKKSLLIKISKNLSYKDTDILKNFVNEQSRILPRRMTGISAKQQKQVARAIKNSRIIGLLPFVGDEGNK